MRIPFTVWRITRTSFLRLLILKILLFTNRTLKYWHDSTYGTSRVHFPVLVLFWKWAHLTKHSKPKITVKNTVALLIVIVNLRTANNYCSKWAVLTILRMNVTSRKRLSNGCCEIVGIRGSLLSNGANIICNRRRSNYICTGLRLIYHISCTYTYMTKIMES